MSAMNKNDRQAGSASDAYSQVQHLEMVNHLLQQEKWISLKIWMAHLVTHNMIGRGDQTRLIQLADLSISESGVLTNDPSRTVTVVRILARQGKENQTGKFETVHLVRHRIPILCPVAAMFFNLLIRFDIQDETIDLFDEKGALGGNYLLFARVPTNEMSYQTHARMVSTLLDDCGIVSSKVFLFNLH
jgi:hypothetical protein